MRVLSLCDYTGNMVRPWLEAGHEAVIVDLQHRPGEATEGSLTRLGANILESAQPDTLTPSSPSRRARTWL